MIAMTTSSSIRVKAEGGWRCRWTGEHRAQTFPPGRARGCHFDPPARGTLQTVCERPARMLVAEASEQHSTGRSSGSRLVTDPGRPSRLAAVALVIRGPGRLQRRPRDGFAPSSLLSPALGVESGAPVEGLIRTVQANNCQWATPNSSPASEDRQRAPGHAVLARRLQVAPEPFRIASALQGHPDRARSLGRPGSAQSSRNSTRKCFAPRAISRGRYSAAVCGTAL